MLTPMTYELLLSLGQTIMMVLLSGLIALLFGLPLGITLFMTRKNAILAHPTLNNILSMIANALRSVPFIILLVALIPFTRLLVGTSIGTLAAIVPLTICAIPFIARIVENCIEEIPTGFIEAGLSMGATPLQIIVRILLPEALPGIINGLTLTLIALVGYSAMAGAVGGGGLGDLAIRYGYQRFEPGVMAITIIILITLVQLIQMTGNFLAKRFTH